MIRQVKPIGQLCHCRGPFASLGLAMNGKAAGHPRSPRARERCGEERGEDQSQSELFLRVAALAACLAIDKREARHVSERNALVAELVDAQVSGTCGESRGGSSPLQGTIISYGADLERPLAAVERISSRRISSDASQRDSIQILNPSLINKSKHDAGKPASAFRRHAPAAATSRNA